MKFLRIDKDEWNKRVKSVVSMDLVAIGKEKAKELRPPQQEKDSQPKQIALSPGGAAKVNDLENAKALVHAGLLVYPDWEHTTERSPQKPSSVHQLSRRAPTPLSSGSNANYYGSVPK